MMQIWEHVGQLDQFFEAVQIPITSAILQIAHEGRAVDRRKYLMLSADNHIAGSVAGNLGELLRRGLAQCADLRCLHAHPIAVNPRTGLTPNLKRLWIITECNANVLHQPINLRLKLRHSGVI